LGKRYTAKNRKCTCRRPVNRNRLTAYEPGMETTRVTSTVRIEMMPLFFIRVRKP